MVFIVTAQNYQQPGHIKNRKPLKYYFPNMEIMPNLDILADKFLMSAVQVEKLIFSHGNRW